MKYHYTTLEWLKLKWLIRPSVDDNVEQLELSNMAGGYAKIV